MIPELTKTANDRAATTAPAREQPSRTYAIDLERGRVGGFVDGQEAMRQAILLILTTERFRYLIYSWRYGSELRPLIGQPHAVMESQGRLAIEEALLADGRIQGLKRFDLRSTGKRSVAVSLTVATVFGPVDIEEELHG